MKLFGVLLLGLLSINIIHAQIKTDKEIDGLKGKVKSVRLERTEISQREGQPVEKTRILQSVITYNEEGNKVEELRYDFNGSLVEKMVFARDDKGHQTATIYKADGTVVSKWLFTFDASGRMTGGEMYNPDGTLKRKMTRDFDASGKLIEGATYDADGSLMNKTLFKYDADGKQVEDAVYNDSGVLMQKYMRTTTGDTVVLYDNDGAVRYKAVSQSPAFELDPQGNWIKSSTSRTFSRGDKIEEVIDVVYRTIVYY